mgnify:CR=1 FL=1
MILNNGNKEWIGEIPENWQLKRLKYVLIQRNENNIPIKSRDILSLTAKQGVIPYSEKEGGGNKPKNNFADYKLAYPGDIVMNSMNILSGSVGISKYFGCVSPVYYMLKAIKPNHTKYFYYLFANRTFQSSLLGIGNGILVKKSSSGKLNTIRMRVPIEKLNNLLIPVPKPDVQKNIIKFLDKKCNEIDETKQNIQEEINKIEEYRNSRITEVITKGLDKKVELKDTNINWIGKIPQEWKIEKIKFLTKSINKGISPNYIETVATPIITQAVFSQGVFNYQQVRQSTDSYELNSKGQVRRNDILLATTGGGVLGKTFYFDSETNDTFLASADVCIIRPNESAYLSKLLYYVIKVNYETLNGLMSTGSTNQIHLNMMAFNNMYIPVMPKEKQKEIVDYLDKIDEEIDEIIIQKNNLLKKLNQYKQSLIYEYVTGKKQVPNVGEN